MRVKNSQKIKLIQAARRRARVRAKIKGVSTRPRLSVWRGNKNIFAQLIDDVRGVTIVYANLREAKDKNAPSDLQSKIAAAFKVGLLLGERALAKNIRKIVFDKGPYKYHGRVKAVADGARAAGLKF
jgi:large subunit ribosomal protein L18